jgi:hypothetical protein
MANDPDWMEEVRRWYLSSARKAAAPPAAETDLGALGYEAAQPSIEARHWPESARTGFIDLIDPTELK